LINVLPNSIPNSVRQLLEVTIASLVIITFIVLFKQIKNVQTVAVSEIKYTQFECPTSCVDKNDNPPEHFYVNRCEHVIWKRNTTLSDKINIIKNHLLNKGSVGVAVLLMDDYDTMMDVDLYEPQSKTRTGGHAMAIIGWKNDAWIIRNSWGTINPFTEENYKNDGYVYWKMGTGYIEDNIYTVEI
jgi:C1A family cysteine protease